MGDWITKKDANGNIYWYNTRTHQRSSGISLTTNTIPDGGTIKKNTEASTGISSGQTRQRDATVRQVNSYNTRAYKVHNHQDQTNHLAQKNQTAALDKNGDYHAVQTNYTPTPEAPMEQVSPEFDLLNMWRIGLSPIAKKAKPLASADANASSGIKTATEIPALSDADILKAYNEAKQYHFNRINSPEWEQAAIRSERFSPGEIPILRNELTTQLNRVKLGSIADEAKKRWGLKVANLNTQPGAQAVHWSLLKPGGSTMDDVIHTVELVNKNMPYDAAVDNFIHELGHAMTSGLGSTAENLARNVPHINLESKLFPLTQRLMDYNNSLLPTRTSEQILNSGIKATERGLNWIRDYLGQATEKTARGYVGKRHIEDLINYAKSNNANSDYNHITQWLGSRITNMQQLNWVGGAENTPNFYKNLLGLTAPVGVFGYVASSNNLASSQYHKQGGQIKYFYD